MKTICIDKSNYSRIADNSEFHTILILGRMINSIRFVQHAALDNNKLESQPVVRQLLNSFLFQCSMIYEIDNWADKNFVKYQNYASWQNGFQKTKSDKTFNDFKKNVLPKMRNKFTFHFDSEYLGKIAKSFVPQGDTVVIVSSETDAHGQQYYELSDIMSLAYLFSAQNDDEIKEELKKMIQKANLISEEFISSCEALINELIHKHFENDFVSK